MKISIDRVFIPYVENKIIKKLDVSEESIKESG